MVLEFKMVVDFLRLMFFGLQTPSLAPARTSIIHTYHNSKDIAPFMITWHFVLMIAGYGLVPV